MSDGTSPYTNEEGARLFDLLVRDYDLWLGEIPHLREGAEGKPAPYTHTELLRYVWPPLRQLSIRLEAQGHGRLASHLERAFGEVERCAKTIDRYCRSEAFNHELWAYGDPAAGHFPHMDGDLSTLEARAREIGACSSTDELSLPGREWAWEIGRKAEAVEIEKYGDSPADDYAFRTAMWAWACFWLAAQLRRRGIGHGEAAGHLERYLSDLFCVSEAKYPMIREVLGRAYGMRIYPIPRLESPEVRRAFDGFAIVVDEIGSAIADAEEAAASPAKHPSFRSSPEDVAASGDVKFTNAGARSAPLNWQSIDEVERRVKKLAPTDFSVLIVGETGTGKEYYAERIHEASRRAHKLFLVINCATLPKERIDSELFGHVKGSFTGATQDYPGKIRQAAGGTVFLDEIGDLPSSCWGYVLRFFQAMEIHPVGGKTTTVDVRILAATNKPERVPEEAVNRFDHVLRLPPLRGRPDDIPRLAKQFFETARGTANKRSLRFHTFERGRLAAAAFGWPGNIRQLEKAIFRAVTLHDSGRDLTAEEVIQAARQVEGLA